MNQPRAVLMMLALILGGCTAPGQQGDPSRHADQLAQPAHLQRELIKTDGFLLTGFYRITRPDLPVNLYIEGDGRAWQTSSQPSSDPTPYKALGLALAASDPAANVVYLARPCQFTPAIDNPHCDVRYWTDKRFAEEVVVAMNQAVSHYVVEGQQVNLVGYSGGGAVAVLIAARRHDVASIRTVAGNLDHAEVNRLHRVTPMPGSLNAIDVARQVASIPQIHFSGADDSVVPPSIAQRFVEASGARCVTRYVVPGMTHESEWAQRWPELLARTPVCSQVP
ncbi:alpha/beta hydrolase family protein [Pseudomonas gingeri]|uniref:alpha/beta hydrolase family protein n=1 Tax=Pseudomonas gingeri TaxID=117681 RepID=UPI001C43668D|nr:alpha/beta hydrolase [Pseudomonas gingeri]